MKPLTSRMLAAVALIGLTVVPAFSQNAQPTTGDNRTRPSKHYTIEQFFDTVSMTSSSQ